MCWCPDQPEVPFARIIGSCQRYLERAPRDFVTFEYVMLEGVNDSVQQRMNWLRWCAMCPCKFNLIPFNPFPQTNYRRSNAML